MDERISNFKVYSLGIVVEDKARKTDHIKVTPIEELPFQNGDIDKQVINYDTKLQDNDGIVKPDKLEGDNFLVAKWLPYGQGNRVSSPDVIKGESVLIFRFGDTDEYYWTTIFNEPNIRRLETVTYAFGDLPTGKEPWNKDSSYYLEVSTHDKYVKFHTSTSDGEPYGYDLFLDTANGNLTVNDTVGNSVILDSPSSAITANANLEVNINTQVANINAETTNISGALNIAGDTNIGGGLHVAGPITTDSNVAATGTVSGSNI